jgi:hypothetical protein
MGTLRILCPAPVIQKASKDKKELRVWRGGGTGVNAKNKRE